MFVVLEKIVQAVVYLDHDDQERTTNTWLLTLPSPGFSRYTRLDGMWDKCLRVSFAAAGEMIVTAEVSRMAAHSATVA